jgi:hypothetical protein
MKTVYPLLTLLSASLVVAAPAPFVVTGDVGAPTANLGRREAAIVHDFSKQALQLRGALVAARGGQKNVEEDAAAAEDQAQNQMDAADEEQAKGKGKGKNADAQAGKPNNEHVISSSTNIAADQAAKDQKKALEAAAGKLAWHFL